MTLTLPDAVEKAHLSPEEIRLELACALFARGRLSRVGATELSGVDFFSFQRALGERGISIVTEQMLDDDLKALETLFPR